MSSFLLKLLHTAVTRLVGRTARHLWLHFGQFAVISALAKDITSPLSVGFRSVVPLSSTHPCGKFNAFVSRITQVMQYAGAGLVRSQLPQHVSMRSLTELS